MYKIGIIEKIHDKGIQLLKNSKKFEYEIIDDISKNNLIKVLPKFDGITLRVAKLDPPILSHCKKLKVISRHGVGYDNVDIKFLKENNIKLLITATANAVSVAEHVMYMILTLSKGIVGYDKMVRAGEFRKAVNQLTTFELLNKEILILGFGRIGQALAQRCLGFEMKVHVYDPFINPKIITSKGCKIIGIKEGFKISDYISVHLPLTEKTSDAAHFRRHTQGTIEAAFRCRWAQRDC